MEAVFDPGERVEKTEYVAFWRSNSAEKSPLDAKRRLFRERGVTKRGMGSAGLRSGDFAKRSQVGWKKFRVFPGISTYFHVFPDNGGKSVCIRPSVCTRPKLGREIPDWMKTDDTRKLAPTSRQSEFELIEAETRGRPSRNRANHRAELLNLVEVFSLAGLQTNW
jgi:hypothetical protein